MGAVKIWIGPNKRRPNDTEVIVDEKKFYGFSPGPQLDLGHFVEWLVEALQIENVEVVDGWKEK